VLLPFRLKCPSSLTSSGLHTLVFLFLFSSFFTSCSKFKFKDFQRYTQFISNTTSDKKVETKDLDPQFNLAEARAKPNLPAVESNVFVKKVDNKIIVIDPGHGGIDSGALNSKDRLTEKEIVLEVATILKKELESLNYEVYLTREEDVFRELQERTSLANSKKADLFISLHVNASGSGQARGIEAYYLDNDSDRASIRLAERENRSPSGKAPDDLALILSDLIQNAKLEESIVLAHLLDDNILFRLRSKGLKVANKGVKKAPFFVLVGAHMPCVLLELLFIDNPEDYKLLSSPEIRRELALGITAGILEFFKKY
jgi:N-acetylmuramoyl-L-alanine amidase